MQGCQLVESHKSAGSGPVRSPETVPARKQTRKQTKSNKAKTGKKHTTTTKPKQKRHREVGSPPAMGITCKMTSYVSLRMAQNKTQNRKTTKHTNGPCWWVSEATKLHAETRDPPARIPEITKSSRTGMTLHPGTPKQTPTTPGRNGSGEKRKNGETGR